MFPILAEAAVTLDYTALAAGGSALLNTSATLWFFYHTNTVTLPQQQKDHREERDRIRAEFLQRIDQDRNEFLARLKEEALAAKEERELLISEIRLNRESFEKWKADHKG